MTLFEWYLFTVLISNVLQMVGVLLAQQDCTIGYMLYTMLQTFVPVWNIIHSFFNISYIIIIKITSVRAHTVNKKDD